MLNVTEFILSLLQYKNFIIYFTLFSTILSIVIALALTPMYKADAVVYPNESEQAAGGIFSELGGQTANLASLAGINLGGNSSEKIALAKLTSRTMKERFITSRNLLPILFADEWNIKKNNWIDSDPEKIPTLWDALKEFEDILFINNDEKAKTIAITIVWSDPIIAAKWANEYILMADSVLRDVAVQQNQASLEFLREQRAATKILDIQQTIDSLYKNELKKMMLANSNEAYFYNIIDVAKAPKLRFTPKRFVIVFLGSFIGLIFSLLLIGIWRFYVQIKNAMNVGAQSVQSKE